MSVHDELEASLAELGRKIDAIPDATPFIRLAHFVLGEVTCLDNHDFADCGECASCAARAMAAAALTKAGLEHDDGCVCPTCCAEVHAAAREAGF